MRGFSYIAWLRTDMAPWARQWHVKIQEEGMWCLHVSLYIFFSLSHVLPVQKWLPFHHLCTSLLPVPPLITLKSRRGLPHLWSTKKILMYPDGSPGTWIFHSQVHSHFLHFFYLTLALSHRGLLPHPSHQQQRSTFSDTESDGELTIRSSQFVSKYRQWSSTTLYPNDFFLPSPM